MKSVTGVNQFLRNVTGATLNKYTVSRAGQKRFIREMYTANAERHLNGRNSCSYQLISALADFTSFVQQLLNAN